MVILLNGVGSAGKTTVAKALQGLASRPFLHLQMDAFLDMLPDALWDHPDGIVFEPLAAGDAPVTAVRTGPVAARLLRGMRRSVAAMAAEGCDLIVDDVTEAPEAGDYRRLLAPQDLRLVALHVRLDVAEARERARGDRHPGLARWQFDRIHRGIDYDLELDTSDLPPEDCARTIARAFGL